MNAEQALIDKILCELNLPKDQFIINGSGVLALHGIQRNRPLGDLDVFCSTRLWFELTESYSNIWRPIMNFRLLTPEPNDPKRRCDPPILRKVIHELTVDVFFQWRRRGSGLGDFDPGWYINNREYIKSWPCAPLQFIMDWKLAMGRNKDLADVLAIRDHLGIDPMLEEA